MHKIAVLGATGNVGREMLSILAERKFPAKEVVALSSNRSAGKELSYGNKIIKVQNAEQYDFSGVSIVLSSVGSDVIKNFEHRITGSGAVIIDNSSCFRLCPEIPLVIPEVNPECISEYKHRNIIANPNCSTIQMVVVLKPLHDNFTINRVVVSTYQAVSGSGKKAQDELYFQTKKMFENDFIKPKEFTKRIAFNCIPHIDDFMESGETVEEWKMSSETQKILNANIKISASCVRVPVFNCHAETLNIEFSKKFKIEDIYDILSISEGILVVDRRANEGYMTQVEATKDDNVFVSRIRRDKTIDNGLNLWIVTDNLRKGAALNAVQIAEILAHKYIRD